MFSRLFAILLQLSHSFLECTTYDFASADFQFVVYVYYNAILSILSLHAINSLFSTSAFVAPVSAHL